MFLIWKSSHTFKILKAGKKKQGIEKVL